MIPIQLARLAVKPPDRRLLMPVRGVSVTKVRKSWHAPRTGRRRHEGEDIFAPRGTPVYSATRGVVIRIEERGLGGKSVYVGGAGGRTYYYTHLDRYAESLEVGDLVTPATLLGYVGNTGNARFTPSHLHFGVYGPTGRAINPRPLISDRRTGRTQPPATEAGL